MRKRVCSLSSEGSGGFQGLFWEGRPVFHSGCVCGVCGPESSARAVQSGGAQDGWDLRSPRCSTPRQVHVLGGWQLSSVSRHARVAVVAAGRVVFSRKQQRKQPPREFDVRHVATCPRFPHSLCILRHGNAKID